MPDVLGLGVTADYLRPLGIPSRLGLGGGPNLSSFTLAALNASTPTYTCATGAWDPYNNVIKYANQRRQRPFIVNGVTYQADLIEQTAANLLATGTSEFFGVTWTVGTGAPTITNAAAASLSGDTDAASFIEGVANGIQSLRQSVTKAASALAYTASIYVKNASGSRSFVLQLDDGTDTNGVSLIVNPATGALVSAPAAFGTGWALNTAAMPLGYKISSHTGSWYRITLSVTSDATTTIRVKGALYNGSTSSYAGNGTSGVYVWAAMLRQANWAGTHVSARNLTQRSEDWSAVWGKTRASTSAAAAANPLTSEANATALIEDATASNTHFTNSGAMTKVASSTITVSGYFKANTRSWILLGLGASGALANGAGAYFDLTNGATGSNFTAGTGWAISSKSITAASSGWYRCQITITTDSGTTAQAVIRLATADNTSSYSGNGTSGLYMYAVQTEYGSAATTYWANSTTSGIRAAGLLLVGTGVSATAGTILGYVMPAGWSGHFNNSTVYRIVSNQVTAANCEIRCSTGATSDSLTSTRVDSAAATIVQGGVITPGMLDGTLIQTAMTWDGNGVRQDINGSNEGTTGGASPTLPYTTITAMSIGANAVASQPNAYVLGLYSASVISSAAQAMLFATASAP